MDIFVLCILVASVATGLAGYALGEVLSIKREQKRLADEREALKRTFRVKMASVDLISGDVVDTIIRANADRDFSNLHRRLLKIGEEFGEACEAYLNSTSSVNSKGLTYADLREEMVDLVIVAVDIALTQTPDQSELTAEQVKAEFVAMVAKKLEKWMTNRKRGIVVTDAE